jgi:hypothetical protein
MARYAHLVTLIAIAIAIAMMIADGPIGPG